MYIHLYLSLSTCICICMCVYIHIYTYIHTYIYIYIYRQCSGHLGKDVLQDAREAPNAATKNAQGICDIDTTPTLESSSALREQASLTRARDRDARACPSEATGSLDRRSRSRRPSVSFRSHRLTKPRLHLRRPRDPSPSARVGRACRVCAGAFAGPGCSVFADWRGPLPTRASLLQNINIRLNIFQPDVSIYIYIYIYTHLYIYKRVAVSQ